MKEDEKPEPKPEGVKPPPRPPKRTATALGPEDDDGRPGKVRPKTETVHVYLPPKAAPAKQ